MNVKVYTNTKKIQKGFTLIELMVSLGLFAIVMTMSASAMLTILDANAKSQSSSAVLTNLNTALDSMTREIRTGTEYMCNNTTTCTCDVTNPSSCPTAFEFVTQEGVHTEYAFDSNNKQITKKNLDDPDGSATAINATEVTVQNLFFIGRGFVPYATGHDLEQPFLQIIVQGEAGVKVNLKTKFNIQTSVSQRLLDSI